MAHDYTSVSYEENVPIKSSIFTPDIGTETIASCTVTLKDTQGATVAAVSAVPATGFISTADAAPYAWYDFNASALSLAQPTVLTGPTRYQLHFLVTDDNGHKYKSVIGFVVTP